jgi:hypothetical protein
VISHCLVLISVTFRKRCGVALFHGDRRDGMVDDRAVQGGGPREGIPYPDRCLLLTPSCSSWRT